MSLGKFKTHSYCVGSGNPRAKIKGHYSATNNIVHKRAKNGRPNLEGKCAIDGKTKTMFVKEDQIAAEGVFGDLFKYGKKVGKHILNNPQRALELGIQLGQAGASRNPALIASTLPQVAKFVKKGKGLYLPHV